MQQSGRPLFRITNAGMNVVAVNTTTPDMGQALEMFDEFLSATDGGYFVIELYKAGTRVKKNGELSTSGADYMEYDFHVTPTLREKLQTKKIGSTEENQPQPDPIMNLFPGGMGGIMDRFLGSKDQIQELNVKLGTMEVETRKNAEMAAMQKKYEDEIAELKKSKGLSGIFSNLAPELIPGLIGQVNTLLKGNQMPINGIEEATAPDAKTKIVQAVNKLTKLDPNFADNISKLAELAERDPQTYKMAIAYLNK